MLSRRPGRKWRILLLVVSASFVVLVGPSRIYLGDHWASDVLGSYLIGGVLLGMTLWIYSRLKREGVLQTQRAKKTTRGGVLLAFLVTRRHPASNAKQQGRKMPPSGG
jgi:membrane-associated phospholipid phosphatase